MGDLRLALYLSQCANVEFTRNGVRPFWKRNEILKVTVADFIPLSTFAFEGREGFPTSGVISYSYCTFRVKTKLSLTFVVRHLVWKGCVYVFFFFHPLI